MGCYRKKLRISYKDHVTNGEVRSKLQQTVGLHEDLQTIVKRHKTAVVWTCLPFIRPGQTILQGTVKGGIRQGRKKKRWEDNIREWTDRATENREKWRELVVKSLWCPNDPRG